MQCENIFFFIFDTFIDTFEKIKVSLNGRLVYGAKNIQTANCFNAGGYPWGFLTDFFQK